jgi:hypothetical protein
MLGFELIRTTMSLIACLPGPSCDCPYSFIGNGCCNYEFRCEEYGFGAPTRSDTETTIDVCRQTLRTCDPCASVQGGCNGTITLTDTGTTSVSAGLQGTLNGLLKGLLGNTFNITASFAGGYSNSTSVAVATTYVCEGSVTCGSRTFTQKLLVRSVTFTVPVHSQTEYRTAGLRPNAPADCLAHPEDCPVNSLWTRINVQQTPCVTGTASGQGADEVSGDCEARAGAPCPSTPCCPANTGPNLEEPPPTAGPPEVPPPPTSG